MDSYKMETIKEYIDVNAAGNEAAVLTIIPAIVTAIWKTAAALEIRNPYLCPIIIMIALAYSSLYFKTEEKGLKTRIALDTAVIIAAIFYGNTTFPLEGPPSQDSAIAQILVGTICIIATVRTLLITLVMGQNYINS